MQQSKEPYTIPTNSSKQIYIDNLLFKVSQLGHTKRDRKPK
jgi:hypothetical protein